MPKTKEKREEVLYVKVTPTNKEMVQEVSKKSGYSTISEYVDTLLTEHRTAIKWKKGKKK